MGSQHVSIARTTRRWGWSFLPEKAKGVNSEIQYDIDKWEPVLLSPQGAVVYASPSLGISGPPVLKAALGEFNLGIAAAMSIIYFLMTLLVCWIFYTLMMRNEERA